MKNHILQAVLAAILVLSVPPRAYAESVRAPAMPAPSLDGVYPEQGRGARDELRLSDEAGRNVKGLQAEDTIAGLQTKITIEATPGTYDLTLVSPHGMAEQHVVEVSSRGEGVLSLSPTQAGEYRVKIGGESAHFNVFATSVSTERSEIEIPRTALNVGENVRGELRLQDRYGNPIGAWPAVIVSTGEGIVTPESERTNDRGILAFTFSSPYEGESDLFALNPITGEQVGSKVRVSVGGGSSYDSFRAFSEPLPDERAVLPRRIVAAGGYEPGVGERAVGLLASLLKRIAELEEEEQGVERTEKLLGLVDHFEFDKTAMSKVVEREQPFDIHIIAKREDGSVDTGFVGEVEVMSGIDDGAQFKKLVTFLASDRGRKKLILGGTLTQVGKQKIIARLADDPEVQGEYEILVVARPAELPLLQNLTIREPKNGSEVSTPGITLRGDSPPYIDLRAVVNGEAVATFSSLGEDAMEEAGYGYEATIDLPKGTAEFEVFVEQVGGLGLTSNVVQLNLDTTKPDILTISIEPLQVVAEGEVFVRLKTELNALVEVALDGRVTELTVSGEAGEVVTYEGTVTAPATPGEYPLTFFATDQAKNRAIAEETLTVTPPPPGAPRDLRAVLEGLDVVLTWEPVTDAKGYRLYFGVDAHSLDRSLSIAAPTPRARVKNLERGRSYVFVVTAINGDDRESEQSNLVTVSVPTDLQHLTVTPVAQGVEFGWTEDVPGEPVTVLVEYGLADGAYTEARTIPYSLFKTTVSDLIDGIGYFFSTSFLNAVGAPVMSPDRFQASPAPSGFEGFHPVAAEEISLPLPFVAPSAGGAGSPAPSVPGYAGSVPDVALPPPFTRPPGNVATGSLSFLALLLLSMSAGAILLLRKRLVHAREQRFLLMMAESYGSVAGRGSLALP